MIHAENDAAFSIASRKGDKEVLKFLLEHTLDPEQRDRMVHTPAAFKSAIESNRVDILELLFLHVKEDKIPDIVSNLKLSIEDKEKHKLIDEASILALVTLRATKNVSNIFQVSKNPFLALNFPDEESGRPGLPVELVFNILRQATGLGENVTDNDLGIIINLIHKMNKEALQSKVRQTTGVGENVSSDVSERIINLIRLANLTHQMDEDEERNKANIKTKYLAALERKREEGKEKSSSGDMCI